MAESVENRVHTLRNGISEGKARAKSLFAGLAEHAPPSPGDSLESLLGRIRITDEQYDNADEPQGA